MFHVKLPNRANYPFHVKHPFSATGRRFADTFHVKRLPINPPIYSNGLITSPLSSFG